MRTFITIDRLEIYAFHGVLEQENEVGNLFLVSVNLEYDFTKAAETDDLSYALNYAELTEIVVETMRHPRKLMETVAMDLKNKIMARWPEVVSGSISISKPHPPIPAPSPRATVSIAW